MNTLGRLSALVLALTIATSLHAAPQGESPELVVPTRMCGEYFLIPLEVDLDGDGISTTLIAFFDTGGAGLHIDPDAVVRAGGAPVEERKQITIRGATAGPLTFRKLRPYTRHLDHISRPLGTQIDIFLPFRAFSEYLLTLDFPRREMRIARGRLPQPDGVELFAARGRDRRPYLETDVGRLDADIEIAGVTVEKPIVEIGAVTELIGTDVMRRFAWTFDQESRRVRIRSESSDPLRLPAVRGSGAILIPALEGYEIVRVLENSPAARVGLRVGDVVVAVDGTRVFERGCDRWNEGNRTETTLSVLREGETFDLLVEVVDIVP